MSAQGRLERVLQVDTRYLPRTAFFTNKARFYATRQTYPQNLGCRLYI
jgi:hypothetical protein